MRANARETLAARPGTSPSAFLLTKRRHVTIRYSFGPISAISRLGFSGAPRARQELAIVEEIPSGDDDNGFALTSRQATAIRWAVVAARERLNYLEAAALQGVDIEVNGRRRPAAGPTRKRFRMNRHKSPAALVRAVHHGAETAPRARDGRLRASRTPV